MALNGNSLLGTLSRPWRQSFDLVFPSHCLGCGLEGQHLCQDCASAISRLAYDECPVCRRPSPSGRTCEACHDNSYLDFLWIAGDYGDVVLKNAIRSLKYAFVTDLVPSLKPLLGPCLDRLCPQGRDIVWVPIPLHRRRLLERGFNQAELVARLAMEIAGGRLEAGLLGREVYASPQAKLNAKERRVHLAGSFHVYDGRAAFYGHDVRIVLVDDVYTTGSTMQECAKALRLDGFRHIGGLAVARGRWG